MSIEKIIMVTGSKGGGGKTPVASSLVLALRELGVPVLACDFNYNNHDLFTIFQGLNINKRRKNKWLNERIFGLDPFWKLNDNLWLTRWHSIMDIGVPSTSEMWEKIDQIIDLKFPPKNEPKVMVIDTNLTIPLICPKPHEIQNFTNLPELEVWHLWSPSIVLQVDEQTRFVKAIDILKRFNPGFEQNMRHIFTPRHYQSNSIKKAFSGLVKGQFDITNDLKYKQNSPKAITFSELKDALFANFLPEILNFRTNENFDISELIETWFNRIVEKLQEREYKTNNVIVIPSVVHNIAMLVEKLTLRPRRTEETIRKDLGKLYNTIKDHLLAHQKYIIPYYTKLT